LKNKNYFKFPFQIRFWNFGLINNKKIYLSRERDGFSLKFNNKFSNNNKEVSLGLVEFLNKS
jgi:hypothetical protein